MIARRLTGAVCAAVALLGVGPAAAALAAPTERSITSGGIARSYLEVVPRPERGQSLPLVVVLHGGTGNAAAISAPSNPFSRWTTLAERRRFAVAYPNGVGGQWSDCRSDARDVTGSADDVRFVEEMIDDMAGRTRIDRRRVFVAGVSNGGMMAYRLAAELPTRVRAIGAVAANLPTDPARSCRAPSRPVSVAIVNGDADPLMPWTGGCVTVLCRGHVRSTADTFATWRRVDGTRRSGTVTRLPDRDRTDGTHIVRTQHVGGARGTRVTLYRVVGGGHHAPSRRIAVSEAQLARGGRQSRDLEVVDELWRFFSTSG